LHSLSRLQSFRALDTETLSMPAGFFTVLISLLFLACYVASAAAAERAPERVRIAVSSKSLGFLDKWAAKKRGFCRQYGLEAEIIAMRPCRNIDVLQLDLTTVEEVLRERR